MEKVEKKIVKFFEYNILLDSLHCDFDSIMQRLYDNNIECMGIVHNHLNDDKLHCHIITFRYLTYEEFENITNVSFFYYGCTKSTIPRIIGYLLHYTSVINKNAINKYKFKDIKTNMNLQEYKKEIIKHGIS